MSYCECCPECLALTPDSESFDLDSDDEEMWGKAEDGGFFSTPKSDLSFDIEVEQYQPPAVRSARVSAPLTADAIRMFQNTDTARYRWSYVLESAKGKSSGGFEPLDAESVREESIDKWRRACFVDKRATLPILEMGYSGRLQGGDLVWLDWTLRKIMVEEQDFEMRERVVRAWCSVMTNWWDPVAFMPLVESLHEFFVMNRESFYCSRNGGLLEGHSRYLYGKNVETTLWLRVLGNVDLLSDRIMGTAKRDDRLCRQHGGTGKICLVDECFVLLDGSQKKAIDEEDWSEVDEAEL